MNQLRLLEFAVALDHHSSLARAVRAMHVTQASFSSAIATLESRLDARLFERNNRVVRPPPAGQILL
jgi:DNA-binding transcriptional LysR family regulator